MKKFFDKIISNRYISYFLIILYSCYYYLTRSSVGNIKEYLMKEFSLNENSFGKISSAFPLSYSLFQIFGGYLLDRFSLQYILPLSLIGIFFSQYMFIHAKNIFFLEYSMYILGFFFSIGVISRLKYLSFLWSKNFILMNGIINILMCVTAAFTASNTFAVYLKYYSWRVIFSIFNIFAIILGILLFFFLKNLDRTKTELYLNNKESNKIEFLQGLKFIFSKKEFILFAIYTMMISTGSYILMNGYGNTLLVTKFNYLNSKLPATLNMLGNGAGSIYNIFVSKISYKKQMLIHGFLYFIALLSISYFNLNVKGILIVFFLIGFSYTGQAIGFLWLQNHGNKKYKALSFSILNFIGVFFGGAMTQRIGGIILDFLIKNNKSPYIYIPYLLIFKLLLIPSIIGLLVTFFIKESSYK